jgi:hypothetical protein
MTVDKELLDQARASEVKAVIETMRVLDPEPGEEPSPELIFSASKKVLTEQGLLNSIPESASIEITLKGQVLLSLMMARIESVSDFIMTLNMSAEDTTKTLDDVCNLMGVDAAISRMMKHIGGGQPGLLINFFSFLIYRSILVANTMFDELDIQSGAMDDFLLGDDDDGTVH